MGRLSKLMQLAGVFAGLATVLALRRRIGLAVGAAAVPTVLFSKFLHDVEEGKVAKVLMAADHFVVSLKASGDAASHNLYYQTPLIPLTDLSEVMQILRLHKISFGRMRQSITSRLFPLALAALPFVYLALTYRMLGRMIGEGSDGVGKTGSARDDKDKTPPVTFSQVAGVDDAKTELVELVNFLKNPEKYKAIGAKLPKGLLLSGPSGTGKTLLARALATEAGVPFISCSASDFVEMLVGRGAARVRDLFTRASECAPCIIFIDELDALAKARGGLNGNDEREQTLNQLLTEMDGFEARADIIVIAATNRPEVLDAALCRPGRFDRHVVVGLPDEKGRKEILKVHTRGVRIEGVVLEEIAKCTEGRTGAELASLVNDAALLAVRSGKEIVTTTEFAAALSRAHKARTAMSFLWA